MISKKLIDKLYKTSINLFFLPNSSKHHFSFIVKRNSIISFGYNDGYKSHPIANRYGHRYNGIHSELSVILNFNPPFRTLNEYDFVNIRLCKDKSFANAKPCGPCTKMLKDFDIRTVYYSTESGFKQYDF